MPVSLRHRPIVEQIVLMSALVCMAVFAALIVLTSVSVNKVARDDAEQTLKQQVQLVNNSLELAYQNVLIRSEGLNDLFKSTLPGEIVVQTDTVATGDAPDAYVVKAGDLVLNGNIEVLEKFKKQTGGEAAVISKTASGKFVRTNTLLKDKDGKSMLGLGFKEDDPVQIALSQGKPYTGLVYRNDRYYLTRLSLIKDTKGNIAGAYSVRVDLSKELDALRTMVKGIKVGKTGYVYVVAPDNDKVGKFVVHPKNEGKFAADAVKGSALDAIKHMIETKEGTIEYELEDPANGGALAPKIVAYASVPDWGWVVASGSFLSEFTEASVALRTKLIIASVIFAALILILLFAALRLRLKPLQQVVHALDRFGGGDLAARINIDAKETSRNEIDRLTLHFNHAAKSLQSLIGEIRHTANAVDGTASGLGSAVEQVASASMRQSESAAGMAATIEQITVSIGHIAENANQAASTGQAALHSAEEGKQMMARTVSEMQRIAVASQDASDQITRLGERSNEISSIVGVIKEIADQTNLLALNAAIEAARAGEQGRGFAVVADEVRKLAERTGASTLQISQLVGGIVNDTQQVAGEINQVADHMRIGVKSVEETGEALDRIHSQTDQVSAVLHDIAEATREQSAASTQLAQGVEAVAQSAEQNSAIAQANSGAARELRDQARALHEKLAHFTG
ncbi:methyl-accepting chemotaxis protein [Andreprevotia chitinilytica]|uniref:methyl-accepting chemotaxis protein n=1 Tax=Andreprevotia chitinilytica TaxID=396808 RepID=UPI00068A9782|nr:Cache 3/Cache 2 fusion domain-containing protein [Andreprevotia chitinilytica]